MNEPGEQGNWDQSLAEALFAEPLKRIQEEQHMREEAARTVLHWMAQKEGGAGGEASSQEHTKVMVREVRGGLQSGDIFFMVKQPDVMPEPVKARLMKVHLPGKRTSASELSIYRPAVALAVRSDATLDQMLAYGDVALEEIYNYHKAMRTEKGRITTKDNILIKEEGCGEFPESVME